MHTEGFQSVLLPAFIFLTGAVLFFRMLKRQEQKD